MEEKRKEYSKGAEEEKNAAGKQKLAMASKPDKEAEADEITVDGLTVREAEEVREIWKRFLAAYKESGEEQEEFAWLEVQLAKELPEKPKEEIQKMKEEIVASIREYDADLQDMTRQVESGRTRSAKAAWRKPQKGWQSMNMGIT